MVLYARELLLTIGKKVKIPRTHLIITLFYFIFDIEYRAREQKCQRQEEKILEKEGVKRQRLFIGWETKIKHNANKSPPFDGGFLAE